MKTLMQENNLVEASGGDASAPAGDAEGKKKGAFLLPCFRVASLLPCFLDSLLLNPATRLSC